MPFPNESDDDAKLKEWLLKTTSSNVNPPEPRPALMDPSVEPVEAPPVEADPTQDPEVAAAVERAAEQAPVIEASVNEDVAGDTVAPQVETSQAAKTPEKPKTFQGMPLEALLGSDYKPSAELQAGRDASREQLRRENLINIMSNGINSLKRKPGQEKEIRSSAGLDAQWAKEDEDNKLRLALGFNKASGGGLNKDLVTDADKLAIIATNPDLTDDMKQAVMSATSRKTLELLLRSRKDVGSAARGNAALDLNKRKFSETLQQNGINNGFKDRDSQLKFAKYNMGLAEYSQGALADYTNALEKGAVIPVATALSSVDKLLPDSVRGIVTPGAAQAFSTSQNIASEIDKFAKGAGQGLGLTDADRAKIDVAYNTLVNQYIKTISGAAVTDPEMKRLESALQNKMFSTPEARLYAINLLREMIGNQVRNAEVGHAGRAAPEELEAARANGLLTTSDPLFRGMFDREIKGNTLAPKMQYQSPLPPAPNGAPALPQKAEVQEPAPGQAEDPALRMTQDAMRRYPKHDVKVKNGKVFVKPEGAPDTEWMVEE